MTSKLIKINLIMIKHMDTSPAGRGGTEPPQGGWTGGFQLDLKSFSRVRCSAVPLLISFYIFLL
jgi:hypothetical protein